MINQQKKILVVEDERPLLEAIKAKLEKSNFSVVTARSVEQALNHLQDIRTVDVIWLDHYLLGKESGLDFVVKCKKEDSWCKNIPIFVISNTASADKFKSYLQFGVEKYYVKAEKRLDEIIEEIQKTLFEKE
jgi:DNA-binding NtrC family response regulator